MIVDLEEVDIGVELNSVFCGYGPVEGCCEHVNISFDSLKCLEYLDNLNNCQILKKESATCSYFIIINIFGKTPLLTYDLPSRFCKIYL